MTQAEQKPTTYDLMKFVPLESSNLLGAFHDGVDLYLKFKRTEAVYRYLNVPREIFENLLSAESAGVYFRTNIGNDNFECSRVA